MSNTLCVFLCLYNQDILIKPHEQEVFIFYLPVLFNFTKTYTEQTHCLMEYKTHMFLFTLVYRVINILSIIHVHPI